VGHPRRLGRDDVAEPWAQAGAAAPRQRSRLIARIVAFPTPGACRATARLALARAIADDQKWIADARVQLDPCADNRSAEETIAEAQRQVDRMRALL
jgi:hypothetical protein